MTLDSIIERLEKAERPDRKLDIAIMNLLDPRSDDEKHLVMGKLLQAKWGAYGHMADQVDYYVEAPKVTSSVDAAIALAEKVLPGWAWKVGTCSVSDDAWVTPDFNSPIHGERLRRESPALKAGDMFDTGFDVDLRPSGRPAIALCIAVLTALKAKQMGVGE